MLRFNYYIKDTFGRGRKGLVEAKDIKEAANLLRAKGYFVISLERTSVSPVLNISSLTIKISDDDIIDFTRQFSTMITAGLSLTESLDILKSQMKNPGMIKIIEQISDDVEGGKTMASALSKYSRYFPRVYLSLVKAGEASGSLNEVMERLADNLEKQRDFKGKVKGALIYPMIVIIGMSVVSFIMMTFVIPKLTSMYKDFGVTLPTPTLILISISNFFASYWYFILAVVFGSISLFFSWRKSPKGRHTFDAFLLKIPIFGKIMKETALVEVTRTMSILISAGIPILETMDIAKGSVDNVLYQEALEDAGSRVEKGFSLGQSFTENPIFPHILGQMVTVGEQTGKMDDALNKLSRFFEAESEMAIKGLTTAIEPLIMVVLGLGVGFLVMAVLMPIYSLTSSF
ncbi:MAG: Tfp pilus biogenesis protein PilC [Candidatus Gottesmanbacteria bacterium GW2011_GWC2_39_8]|uniref:Tfp pilus biogenesis protein PilC n=1 Tax=Candidatus Gottesmanbacteria bacterium GW2011_GWC2_39_8 TaxID=1618450 RepID=A0A0G0SAF9_9BACT|nr:MAG: Tfp pilus biogenesis protein PilC [Candidatus Gottesmanbacteria bacterium GW2011_GWC2_39_8]